MDWVFGTKIALGGLMLIAGLLCMGYPFIALKDPDRDAPAALGLISIGLSMWVGGIFLMLVPLP